jgi:hypothetical protein
MNWWDIKDLGAGRMRTPRPFASGRRFWLESIGIHLSLILGKLHQIKFLKKQLFCFAFNRTLNSRTGMKGMNIEFVFRQMSLSFILDFPVNLFRFKHLIY